MNPSQQPSFDDPDLALAVGRLREAEIHALPYGAIHLDAQGRVIFYNDTEARQSGYGSRPVAGRDFFTEIAPCLAHEGFLGRIEQARAAGRLDIELCAVGDFDDADKELRYRIQSTAAGGIWIFTERL